MRAKHAPPRRPSVPPWAVILAGGDGLRLRALTTLVAGDARPKQFCPLLGGQTLLECTRHRADLLVRFDHQVVAVSRPHEPYYRYLLGELAPDCLAVQPENRDTGPGILYALLRVKDLAGDVPVALFPSDHYVADDQAFARHARAALEVVQQQSGLVALIGIEPSSPEVEYGWIEPARLPLLANPDVFPVRRFVEKPSAALASELMARGCLWNSLVLTGWVDTLLALIHRTVPALCRAFEPACRARGRPDEQAVLERIYAEIPAISFAQRVLTQAVGCLVTLQARGLEWSDWGSPRRVVASLRATHREPPWLARVEAATA